MRFITVSVFLLFLFRLSYSQVNQENDSLRTSNPQKEILAMFLGSDKIIVDGELNEGVWKTVSPAKNFVEIEPGDNSASQVETEVYVTYDADNLYFGFVCFDKDISKLRANVCDRDKMFSDDFVGVILDTYCDFKQGYEFYVNPYGIQGDLIIEPNNEDSSPDFIWESGTRIYKDRWTAEFAIPFKSIRFPDKNELSFGVHFIRTWPRQDRVQMSWAPISRDNPSFLGQAGMIKGIKNVKRGKNLEILPYVIGSVSGYLRDDTDPSSKFVADSVIKGDAGVNIKYGFTSNLTGEIAVNPDFSQVESDAAVIDVNSSSAIQYPEKRPFFLEGSNIFRTRIQTVYSRMINDPLAAAKLTGKAGDFSLGYIIAYDRNTPFIVPYDYGSFFVIGEKLKSLTNILRVKRDLGGESFLGIIATDREIGKAYNRVIGFDGTLNFWNNYYFNWLALSYNTREVNDTNLFNEKIELANSSYDIKFDGEKLNGFGGLLSVERRARHWNFSLSYYDTPPETRRDVGYAGSVNWRELDLSSSYLIYLEKGFFRRLEPLFDFGIDYRHNTGKYYQAWAIPGFYLQTKGQISFNASFLAVNDEEYKGVFHKGVRRGWFNLNINSSNTVNGGSFFEIGHYIVRFKTPSFVGFGFDAQMWCTVNPTSRLSIENNYNYSELSTRRGGEKLYAGYVFRNKTSYQFSKNLFLRLIVQYDSFDKRFDIDPLVSYKWSPFTIFYIGSTHILYDYGRGDLGGSKIVESNRQFFAKFQYLFRI